MLVSLNVRDVVLIDRLSLRFEPGLWVLTGETGAGKSILLDALGLALGARGDAALVRRGAKQAAVAAEVAIEPDHPACALLGEHGLACDETLVLRRVLGADGRSRAFVNDQPVSVGLLRALGDTLVEIQGHQDQRGLMDPSTHRALLDGFAGLGDESAAVAQAHRRWRAAEGALAKADAEIAEARREEDVLRYALGELEALAPEAGEDERLAARRTVLMNAQKLGEALSEALGELVEERGVEERLRAAERRLGRMAARAAGTFEAALAALGRASVEAREAVAAVEALGRDLEADPRRLDEVEQRLFALRAAARKHGTDVDSLPRVGEDIAARLKKLDDREGEVERLRAELVSARGAFVARARKLSRARSEAAAALDRSVNAELPALRLGKATFHTRLDRRPEEAWSEAGAEKVSFEVATNPGASPMPLQRIVSRGELSRFVLALKVVLARVSRAPTLIFDEVDSGISGAVAAAVGERLARLSEDLQVFVVTHSPQVAARGRQHLRVVKEEAQGGVVTRAFRLEAVARREEVARMLAGARVTEEARAAADSLIEAGAP